MKIGRLEIAVYRGGLWGDRLTLSFIWHAYKADKAAREREWSRVIGETPAPPATNGSILDD